MPGADLSRIPAARRLSKTRAAAAAPPSPNPRRTCPRVPAGRQGGGAPMTYVIAEPCIDVKDKACIEECPLDCIYEGERMLYIHPDECVDCGACEPVCPVEAIFYEDDVPAQWAQFTAENAKFFGQLASPGGAAKTGPLPYDTDHVTGQ